jgi:signal transduction histidine kinase
MNEQLAVVTHELRNSVGAIRFATRLIEMNQREPTIVESARVIIDRQASQMSRLIEDLLEVSLIRSGRFCLQRERVDLCVVAKQAVESIEPEISHRFQRLTVALPEAPVWLQADPGRLARVLVNLLSNAAKYTDKRGELRLSIEREAGWATVRVRDSGIGMARHVLPHVFEPFMQAESSLSRSEMGVGLGLALVSSIVELHGGRVTAASAGLGKGSEFTVQLPANFS